MHDRKQQHASPKTICGVLEKWHERLALPCQLGAKNIIVPVGRQSMSRELQR